ncbi:MAG: P1 family peptidase [Clostridiales bacterium]|jgi:L-aminopeptidase/D-esterase-like protein|nr:P1 family peptidase [Clostridiales bacterium]
MTDMTVRGICGVDGIEVGHAQDEKARTGCTVVLCKGGAVAGVDVRGGAPGTRETDLLRPGFLVERVHAVLLAGGSAFGLDAAGGVMRYLEENGAGFDAGAAKVPIVPAAVIFDLGVGDPSVRPDAAMGYAACRNASAHDVKQGAVGAGCGATVGKALGPENAMDGGVGTASVVLPGGAVVGAIVAVNALGDVIDPDTQAVVAGAKHPDGTGFANSASLIKAGAVRAAAGANTTIGVVATDAALDCAKVNRLASAAHDGLARCIRPCHTMLDGDTLFALSAGEKKAEINAVMEAAAEAVSMAVLNAVARHRA